MNGWFYRFVERVHLVEIVYFRCLMNCKKVFVLCVLFLSFALRAQNVWIQPNKGQWDERIIYNIELTNGNLFIEPTGFTYSLSDVRAVIGHAHNEHDGHDHAADGNELIKGQVIRSEFLGASWKGEKLHSDSSDFYKNYILGNDPKKWRSWIYSYATVEMQNLYDGIDLLLDGSNEQLRYSFRIAPGKDHAVIQKEIKGANGMYIDEDGRLHILHRFGEIIESAPIAWTEKEGRRTPVESAFYLEDDVVSFYVGSHDPSAVLIIDPSLTFSTFTGSVVDNWGFTAAPDANGNLYAGGIVFGTGYPLTSGAYDVTFNGGTGNFPIDVGITKFNANGNALIYSTYIGGSGNETPNSIIGAPNGDLFIYGVTSSVNFPMAGTPYDPTFNGGPTVTENSLSFNGTDIFIARLNPTGTGLIASTFVGGNGTDGLNIENLQYNYGDQFRGEIVLDANMNVYVASTTYSANFPVVSGMQGGISGLQDAVAFRMPPTLNTLTWSTFFGGTGLETGNAIQLSSTGDVYLTGGTTSTNLPITVGEDLTYNGGISDGYVVRLNGTNGSFLSGTYMGYNEYDQAYFVQLDVDDKVYIFGQSQSAWPITPGLYGNPNSGQFIRKYSQDLSAIEWTTMIGASTGNVEISPTAFLVSDCYDIYFSGWGGVLNQNASLSQALFSTSTGFPITPDAFQPVSNGSNFYIGVLGQDAGLLKYGTFMGGTNSSSNHVDGGTSRFDKSGRIYHAVCGACGGNDFGFTSTPGSWSPANPSPNCNMAAFKFELSQIDAIVSEPEPLICIPDPVVFSNNSSNGNSFFWSFGDGATSSEVNPTHFYTSPGDYTVTLVVSDSNGCFTPDSVTFIVNIGDFQGGVIEPSGPICPGTAYQLEAFGGSVYQWTPANVLDDPSSPTPVAVVDVSTLFTVVVSDSCGSDTIQVLLSVFPFEPIMSNDTSICIGNSAFISVSDGATFNWMPAATLDNPTISNPTATPGVTTTYFVEVVSAQGCLFFDSVQVSVYFDPPVPILPDVVSVCEGASIAITAGGAESYFWSPDLNISSTTGATVTITPQQNMYYYCDFVNACGTVLDSVLVEIIQPLILAGNDTIVCPGEIANLWASGGVSYSWSPSSSVVGSAFGSSVAVRPVQPTSYTVVGTDQFGCTAQAQVFVDLFPLPFVQTSPDVYAIYGDEIVLSATSTTPGIYIWSPAEYVGCVVCPSTLVSPNQNMTFTVSYTDVNGCSASDQVSVYYDPFLYIPNTFTPDGNEFNNVFHIVGGNISSFELWIFNRWGELVYTITSFDDFWDGTYKGIKSQDGTYVWKIRYYGFEDDNVYEQTGHVNLLR